MIGFVVASLEISFEVVPDGDTAINATLPLSIFVLCHILTVFKVLNQVFLTPAGELVLIGKPRPMQMNGVDGAEHIVEPVAVKHCVHNRVIDENGLDGFVGSPAVFSFKPFESVLCHIAYFFDYALYVANPVPNFTAWRTFCGRTG